MKEKSLFIIAILGFLILSGISLTAHASSSGGVYNYNPSYVRTASLESTVTSTDNGWDSSMEGFTVSRQMNVTWINISMDTVAGYKTYLNIINWSVAPTNNGTLIGSFVTSSKGWNLVNITPQTFSPGYTYWLQIYQPANDLLYYSTSDMVSTNMTYVALYNNNRNTADWTSIDESGEFIVFSMGYLSTQPTYYPITFNVHAPYAGASTNVTIGGTYINSSASSKTFYAENGTYSYTVAPINGHYPTPSSGTITVSGHSENISISFANQYVTTFTETGLMSGDWSVNIAGSLYEAPAGGSISLYQLNGSYSFAVPQIMGYVSNPKNGTYTVAGSPVSETIVFQSSGASNMNNWTGLAYTNVSMHYIGQNGKLFYYEGNLYLITSGSVLYVINATTYNVVTSLQLPTSTARTINDVQYGNTYSSYQIIGAYNGNIWIYNDILSSSPSIGTPYLYEYNAQTLALESTIDLASISQLTDFSTGFSTLFFGFNFPYMYYPIIQTTLSPTNVTVMSGNSNYFHIGQGNEMTGFAFYNILTGSFNIINLPSPLIAGVFGWSPYSATGTSTSFDQVIGFAPYSHGIILAYQSFSAVQASQTIPVSATEMYNLNNFTKGIVTLSGSYVYIINESGSVQVNKLNLTYSNPSGTMYQNPINNWYIDEKGSSPYTANFEGIDLLGTTYVGDNGDANPSRAAEMKFSGYGLSYAVGTKLFIAMPVAFNSPYLASLQLSNIINLNSTNRPSFPPAYATLENTTVFFDSNSHSLYLTDSNGHIFRNVSFSQYLTSSISDIISSGNKVYILGTLTNTIYQISFKSTVPLYIQETGLPYNLVPSVAVSLSNGGVFNLISQNTSVNVFPGSYSISINAPPGYSLVGASIKGKASIVGQLSLFGSSETFNMSILSDPTLVLTFEGAIYGVLFDSNLNLGTTWLVDHNLEKNVTWTVDILHGKDPSLNIINSNYLPSSDANDTNYTLVYSVTTQNMTFYLQNGTYSYKILSGSSEFIAPNGGNLTVSGVAQSFSVGFIVNYPHAVISFVPSKIPLDTAWVLSAQNSTGGQGLSIKSYSWTITGPLYYQFSGEMNVIYFNVTGNYTISLTVTNQYGLENITSVTTEVIKFTKTPTVYISISLKGTLTNTSAEYQIEVRIPSNMSIASIQGIIDNTSAMNIKFVNSSITGNYTYYFYLATFNPSNYPLGTHFLNFSAYTTSGYFDYRYLTLKFGATKTTPFNLINALGGPENFWAMVAALIGVIVTVAALKVQRTSDVIIEANGHESILKAKPVKTKKLKKKGGRKI